MNGESTYINQHNLYMWKIVNVYFFKKKKITLESNTNTIYVHIAFVVLFMTITLSNNILSKKFHMLVKRFQQKLPQIKNSNSKHL